jgi:CBS domain-containing protein
MKVQQILQRKQSNAVETVEPGSKIHDVAAKLSEMKIGCMLVVNESRQIQGIVSERDIVRILGQRGGGCLDDDVSSVMTEGVITCSTDDDDNSVLEKMTNGRFRHMPVMKDGDLAGLISIGDVVKARIDSLKMENEELENMIRAAQG